MIFNTNRVDRLGFFTSSVFIIQPGCNWGWNTDFSGFPTFWYHRFITIRIFFKINRPQSKLLLPIFIKSENIWSDGKVLLLFFYHFHCLIGRKWAWVGTPLSTDHSLTNRITWPKAWVTLIQLFIDINSIYCIKNKLS